MAAPAYRIPWWRAEFTDAEAKRVSEALLGGHVSQGAITAQFEAEMAKALGVPYVVATTSGSVALLLALMAMRVGAGDDVIVPNRTWIATAHAVAMLGARTILVDVVADVPVMDVAHLEAKITPRTKAIMPVHLNGRGVDMAAVRTVAERHGARLVEDAAQSLFSRGPAGFLGTEGDVACFSMSIPKLVSTGQGGFVTTRDPETYERLRMIRTHGVADTIDVRYTELGFNFKFTDLQAAIGLEQIARAPARIARLRAVYARYQAAMPELPFLRLLPVDIAAGAVPIYVEVLSRERADVMGFLREEGIQTRPFYPDLNVAAYLKTSDVFPCSKVFGEQGIFLPGGPEQPIEAVDEVIDALRRYARRRSR